MLKYIRHTSGSTQTVSSPAECFRGAPNRLALVSGIRGSAASYVPLDICQIIFNFVYEDSLATQNLLVPDGDFLPPHIDDYSTLLSLVRICKLWKPLVLPLLYRRIRIADTPHPRIARNAVCNPRSDGIQLGAHVRSIFVRASRLYDEDTFVDIENIIKHSPRFEALYFDPITPGLLPNSVINALEPVVPPSFHTLFANLGNPIAFDFASQLKSLRYLSITMQNFQTDYSAYNQFNYIEKHEGFNLSLPNLTTLFIGVNPPPHPGIEEEPENFWRFVADFDLPSLVDLRLELPWYRDYTSYEHHVRTFFEAHPHIERIEHSVNDAISTQVVLRNIIPATHIRCVADPYPVSRQLRSLPSYTKSIVIPMIPATNGHDPWDVFELKMLLDTMLGMQECAVEEVQIYMLDGMPLLWERPPPAYGPNATWRYQLLVECAMLFTAHKGRKFFLKDSNGRDFTPADFGKWKDVKLFKGNFGPF